MENEDVLKEIVFGHVQKRSDFPDTSFQNPASRLSIICECYKTFSRGIHSIRYVSTIRTMPMFFHSRYNRGLCNQETHPTRPTRRRP